MQKKTHALASTLLSAALTLLVAGSAQAAVIAGWDFSNYFGPNTLSTDGSTYTDTLDANYSDLDPTFGAGAESAAYGTMYMDGSSGSTNVDESSATAAFVPTSGSLASNIDAPSLVDFDAHTVLASEGQMFTNSLAMTARDDVSIVFEADLSVLTAYNGWTLSFGGSTFTGTSTVTVDFSTDGIGYHQVGEITLDTTDTLFSVDLGIARTDNVFVRLNFTSSGTDQPIIDNLSIEADTVAAVPALPSFGPLALGALMVFTARRRLHPLAGPGRC